MLTPVTFKVAIIAVAELVAALTVARTGPGNDAKKSICR
jgi:hypothetical protein